MHLLIFSFFSIVSVFRHLHQHWQRLNKYLASFCDLFVQQCYFAYVKASFKPDIIGVDPNKRFRDFVQWARVQSLLSYIYIYIFFFFSYFISYFSPFTVPLRGKCVTFQTKIRCELSCFWNKSILIRVYSVNGLRLKLPRKAKHFDSVMISFSSKYILLDALVCSMTVFWLALRARRNMAQLTKILSDTTHQSV